MEDLVLRAGQEYNSFAGKEVLGVRRREEKHMQNLLLPCALNPMPFT
jgi:hypothetical protein